MKRIFDLVLALGIFLLFFPLFVMISIVIYCFMGRPIFFIQKRPGKLGKIFKFIKFRTMKNLPRSQHSDEERLTRVGHFLRKTSLDEIPSLINVIKGEMSLVGPRPLLVKYLNLYTKRQMRRHDVLPGVTGWSQIKGRNALSWEEKFEYDLWYVKNQSFFLDFKILLITLKKVLLQENISSTGHATCKDFEGSRQHKN